MVFAKIEDRSGRTIEVVVFNSVLQKTTTLWEENNVVLMEGKVSKRDGETKFLCDKAVKL
jgi:DNA polymerase III alpha subunit